MLLSTVTSYSSPSFNQDRSAHSIQSETRLLDPFTANIPFLSPASTSLSADRVKVGFPQVMEEANQNKERAGDSIYEPKKAEGLLELEYPKVLNKKELNKLSSVEQTRYLAEKQNICDKFQVGDVIVTHLNKGIRKTPVDGLIRFFQIVAKALGLADAEAPSSAIHIAIVVGIDRANGRVLISEAMPSRKNGLRTVDLLSHNSCVLNKYNAFSYQIFRGKSQYAAIALRAAEFALNVAPKAKYLLSDEKIGNAKDSKNKKNLNKFSFFSGLRAMFKSNKNMDINAQKRIFKGISENNVNAASLIGKKSGRKVYCSAFAAQIFQRAFAEQAWNKLVQKYPELQAGLSDVMKQTEGLTNLNQRNHVSKWALDMAQRYGKELMENMEKFNINYKYTTPQDFVAYMAKANVASPIFNLTAPN